MSSGKLNIVATPIGNLSDITIRAVKTLCESDFIACEDTRKTGLLMKFTKDLYIKNFESTPKDYQLISYFEHNEEKRIPQIINALKNGFDISLVSDSGTPAISDPGFKLIRECIKEGIDIFSIPGPNAAIAALVSSGFATDKFFFLGFPPHKKANRARLYEKVKTVRENINTTFILYESPHKIEETLDELRAYFGDIEIAIARELTKVFEEKMRGKISEIISSFKTKKPKGELVVLFS